MHKLDYGFILGEHPNEYTGESFWFLRVLCVSLYGEVIE